MLKGVENLSVSKLVCRECRTQIVTSKDVAKAILLAVEHSVYNNHKPYAVAMILHGMRGGHPIKHTVAV